MATVPRGRVVLLNGPSSSGKSSIALALQERLPGPWLRLGIDRFLDFVPEPLVNVTPSATDGFRFFPAEDDGAEVTRIAVGAYGRRVVQGMHRAIAAMAVSGLDVIVDDVLLEPSWLDDYLVALAGIDVLFVGVTAPLEVLEEREMTRGDRFPRLARGHYDVVHHDGVYDLCIDTSRLSIDDGARSIAERLEGGAGRAFDQLRLRRSDAATAVGLASEMAASTPCSTALGQQGIVPR